MKKTVNVQNSLFLVKKTRACELKIIISVRKKLFKKANVRNKIKRQIREVIRKDVKRDQKMFYLIIVSKFYDPNVLFEKKRKKLLELL